MPFKFDVSTKDMNDWITKRYKIGAHGSPCRSEFVNCTPPPICPLILNFPSRPTCIMFTMAMKFSCSPIADITISKKSHSTRGYALS